MKGQKSEGPKEWRPGQITSVTPYEVGDKVEVKMYKTSAAGERLSKWFPGQVVDFGRSAIFVLIQRPEKPEIWPFPLGDIRKVGRSGSQKD